MEKQLVLFRFPGVTAKQYDQTWDELRKAGMQNPPGLIYHVGAPSGNDWVVSDVWESKEAFTKFGETLMPIMDKVGLPKVQPEITPVHYEFRAVKS